MANGRREKRSVRKSVNNAEDKQIQRLDDLLEFEKFRDEILPALREDLKTMDADALYKKYSALAAARTITLALRSQNESAVLTATKEILDRSQGKAKERSTVEHRLGRLPDQELEALLLSKIESVETEES